MKRYFSSLAGKLAQSLMIGCVLTSVMPDALSAAERAPVGEAGSFGLGVGVGTVFYSESLELPEVAGSFRAAVTGKYYRTADRPIQFQLSAGSTGGDVPAHVVVGASQLFERTMRDDSERRLKLHAGVGMQFDKGLSDFGGWFLGPNLILGGSMQLKQPNVEVSTNLVAHTPLLFGMPEQAPDLVIGPFYFSPHICVRKYF